MHQYDVICTRLVGDVLVELNHPETVRYIEADIPQSVLAVLIVGWLLAVSFYPFTF